MYLRKWTFQNGKNIIAWKNQHLTFKLIRFRTLSYYFLIWAFWWVINFFLLFLKLYIWVNGHSRIEKIFLHAKNQHPTFKIIHFRTLSYCFLIWAFWWGSIFSIFSKTMHLSWWTFQNEKDIHACKKSAPYLQIYPFYNHISHSPTARF